MLQRNSLSLDDYVYLYLYLYIQSSEISFPLPKTMFLVHLRFFRTNIQAVIHTFILSTLNDTSHWMRINVYAEKNSFKKKLPGMVFFNFLYTYLGLYVCVYIYIYAHTHASIYMYLCVYIYIYHVRLYI